MSKIKALLPNGQETEINVTEVTLLSVSEAKRIPRKLRGYSKAWWLRSQGSDFYSAAFEYGGSGGVYAPGHSVYITLGVRPALRVRGLSSLNLKTGAVVGINDCSYYVIPGDMLLSKEGIGDCSFRDNWRAPDANVYEKSDIKKFVDDWALNQGFIKQPEDTPVIDGKIKVVFITYMTGSGERGIQKQYAFISGADEKIRITDEDGIINKNIRMPLVDVEIFDSYEEALKKAETYCPYGPCSWGGIYVRESGEWKAVQKKATV